MIHVVALITTQPGKRAEVLEVFRANVPAVHDEEGCIEYGPVIDAEGAGATQSPLGPDTFCVIEKWSSMEALVAHSRSAHMAAYADRVRSLLVSRTIHVLSAV